MFLILTECESLVRKMLVRDPVKRYTLKMVRKHVWMQADIKAAEAAKDYSCKPLLQKAPAVINEQILRSVYFLGKILEKIIEVIYTLQGDAKLGDRRRANRGIGQK